MRALFRLQTSPLFNRRSSGRSPEFLKVVILIRDAGVEMLLSVNRSPILGTSALPEKILPPTSPKTCRRTRLADAEPAAKVQGSPELSPFPPLPEFRTRSPLVGVSVGIQPQQADSLYLFACFAKWEQEEAPSAAWELLEAAQSPR